MAQIRSIIAVNSSDGKTHVIAELHVDSSSDLPEKNFGNYVLELGSIAHDVSTGDFYAIDSSGEWHNQGD